MADPLTSDFERLIARIGRALEAAEVPYMVIGGQAVLLHGEPRFTQDIDVTLGVDPDALPDVVEICRAVKLEPLPEDPAGFVRETFVLPGVARETGVRVDFIFSTRLNGSLMPNRDVHSPPSSRDLCDRWPRQARVLDLRRRLVRLAQRTSTC